MPNRIMSPSPPLMLVVEDSDEDFLSLRRFFKELDVDCEIARVCDGEEALDYLYKQGDYENAPKTVYPTVILMDLNLPGTDGKEVIKIVKQNETLKTIPIVVFTTSSRPNDIETCYQYGANSYLLKPMGLAQLKETISVFCDYWLKLVISPASARYLNLHD